MPDTKVKPCEGCPNRVAVDSTHQGKVWCHDCKLKDKVELTKAQTNGDLPAHPAVYSYTSYDPMTGIETRITNDEADMGMTKREEFAKFAMQGIMAADPDGDLHPDSVASMAYAQADCMLREGAKA